MKFKFGTIDVTVRNAGTGEPPWRGGSAGTVYKYQVSVSDGSARYSSTAWGSIHDYERKHRDPKGIGAMVVDELLSANADPDEFVSLVMGGATGREALRLGKVGEKVCKAAAKFSYDALSNAVDDAREQNLL